MTVMTEVVVVVVQCWFWYCCCWWYSCGMFNVWKEALDYSFSSRKMTLPIEGKLTHLGDKNIIPSTGANQDTNCSFTKVSSLWSDCLPGEVLPTYIYGTSCFFSLYIYKKTPESPKLRDPFFMTVLIPLSKFRTRCKSKWSSHFLIFTSQLLKPRHPL